MPDKAAGKPEFPQERTVKHLGGASVPPTVRFRSIPLPYD